MVPPDSTVECLAGVVPGDGAGDGSDAPESPAPIVAGPADESGGAAAYRTCRATCRACTAVCRCAASICRFFCGLLGEVLLVHECAAAPCSERVVLAIRGVAVIALGLAVAGVMGGMLVMSGYLALACGELVYSMGWNELTIIWAVIFGGACVLSCIAGLVQCAHDALVLRGALPTPHTCCLCRSPRARARRCEAGAGLVGGGSAGAYGTDDDGMDDAVSHAGTEPCPEEPRAPYSPPPFIQLPGGGPGEFAEV